MHKTAFSGSGVFTVQLDPFKLFSIMKVPVSRTSLWSLENKHTFSLAADAFPSSDSLQS